MPDREKPGWHANSDSNPEFALLIRNAAGTYGEPASNSDLAERILVRIAAEARPVASRRWLAWAVAVPIAVCLVAFFIESRPVHTPASLSNKAHIAGELNNNVAQAVSNQPQPKNRKRLFRNEVRPYLATVVAKTQSPPRLDEFPTPQPLTLEEKALVEFAARAPMSERKSFIEAQQQPDAPLTIAVIKIQPIELPELGTH